MNILQTKFTRQRKPEFQLQTTVFEENGKAFVRKTALTEAAQKHIKSIIRNKAILESVTIDSNFQYNAISSHTDDSVTFEIIKGQTIEQLLIIAFKANDKKLFFKTLEQYYSILEKTFKTKPFNPDISFLGISKDKWQKLSGKPAFATYSNIDQIPGNIIKQAQDNYVIIDYEWVYEVSLPIDYIFYRGIFMLAERCSFDSFIPKDTIFSHFKLSHEECEIYNELEVAFNQLVIAHSPSSKNKIFTKILDEQKKYSDHLAELIEDKNNLIIKQTQIIEDKNILISQQQDIITAQDSEITRQKEIILRLTDEVAGRDDIIQRLNYKLAGNDTRVAINLFIEAMKREVKSFSLRSLPSTVARAIRVMKFFILKKFKKT